MAAVESRRKAGKGAAERVALLALSRRRRRGTASVIELVERHGSAAAAFAADPRRGPDQLDEARADLEEAGQLGVAVLAWGDPDYPAALRDLAHPPPVLFAQGPAGFDERRSVAIVGTRAASDYGRRMAYRLARELGGWGWTVVSGMARGIDGEAHAGVLDAGGASIGVLGHGHGHAYPREHRELYARMREAGLLLSEFTPSTGPRRSSFPRRNRLIAALARAVIVVEAGRKSGALITAGQALDLGREVLAVPGRVDDPAALGVCGLLRDGAGVVTRARDVFDALGWLHDGRLPAATSPEWRPAEARTDEPAGPADDRKLLALLDRGPLPVDEIARQTGATIASALARLGRLELDGWIEQRADGRFRAAAGSRKRARAPSGRGGERT